jgi:diguanylate cyclase (GGDEF)-like protein
MAALGFAVDATLAVLLGLASLSLYLRLRLSRARGAGLALEGETARLQRELTLARRQLTLFQAEQAFMSQFLREFPNLTADLHGGVSERRIPRALLSIVMRVLQPRQAVVLLRRHKSESDPDRDSRLTVAAAEPADGAWRAGQEVAFGQGPIGLVAESQRAMDQRDFEARWRDARGARPECLAELDVELAAPMVLGQETVGVLAVSGASHSSSEAKDVLRLIAQIGALATHYVSAYTEVKVTADLDGLTGVYNKRHVTEVLTESLLRTQQQAGSSLAVFLFDIDHFKHYNDTNGHAAGDRVLMQLARLVEENVRKENAFGRFGGEEFLLVLPDTSPEQALIVAEKVRYLIAHHSFPFGEKQPLGSMTISGGIAAYPAHGLDTASLLEAADIGLYEAKRQGRNRVLSGRARRLAPEHELPLPLPKGRLPGDGVNWDWNSE